MAAPFQRAYDDAAPVRHPADDLYTYTLHAQLQPPRIEHDRYLPLLMESPPPPQLEPLPADSLVRLKTMKAILMVQVVDRCMEFIRRRIPRTPIRQPRNPNVDDRPTSFFLNCPGFDGRATSAPITNIQEMADWTMRILETVGTVMTLVFPHARGLKFSRTVDDEIPNSVVNNDIYVPLYYKKTENHAVRVNESLVKLVVAQLAPWSLSRRDIKGFVRMSEFPSSYIGSDGQLRTPDSLNRLQRIWARLWSECARVSCPFFILTTGEIWILGAFISGRTQAIHFQLSYQRDNIPSLFQWLIFWCASALDIPGSWSPLLVQESPNPDVHTPGQLQLEEDNITVSDQVWMDAYAEPCNPGRYRTVQEGENVWRTYIR